MKHLLLITVFVVALMPKSMAQGQNPIKISHLQKESPGVQSAAQKENHRFEIVAYEDLDVNLKFSLKEEDNINIVVTDQNDKVVLTKKIKNKGENRLDFSMSQDEKYIVKLVGEKQSNLIVNVSKD